MKEYLASLMPLLRGETVRVHGERVTTNAFAPIEVPGATAPPVLVAALGRHHAASWPAPSPTAPSPG